MSTVYHILDEPLPLSQDFRLLKDAGLEFIQDHSGTVWTNLNPSDPGITILDQVCYALTELGYCNDFPLRDILTDNKGNLELKDQFYLPERILTTSPVTIDDYRKYIIDGIEEVTNVYITPALTAGSHFSGAYNVYLQLDESDRDEKRIAEICIATGFYLNKRRNLDEFFLPPRQLVKIPGLLHGSIEIDNESNLTKVLTGISDVIRNYIFPAVNPVGYASLAANGMLTNEIFNGPLLLHGWIPTNALGEKKNRLYSFELTDIVSLVNGVSAVGGLSLEAKDGGKLPATGDSEILSVDVISSFKSGLLKIYSKGRQISDQTNIPPSAPGKSLKTNPNILFGATVNVQTELPKGSFRDIDSYYSIQNTFPEIFAVGQDAADSDAPDFRIAQSRQLKGYLTLFDQVLANQFSQLASIDEIFSFKNSMTNNTRHFGRGHHQYPVQFRVFSPTYFYQPLYEIPHIRPLLKNNESFTYSIDSEPRKAIEQKSWEQYKKNGYNAYIRGLMEFMEDEQESMERRNNILDHLLARHGESPLLMNRLIDGMLYTGDRIKGLVIFKSLYLQNLGLLSYHRQKAYNFIGATRLDRVLPKVTEKYIEELLPGDTFDFIFKSGKIDQIEKIKLQDFSNYSAFELKMALLLGMRVQYRNYISSEYEKAQENKTESIEAGMALWMIRQRKGMLFFETGLLFEFGGPETLKFRNDPAFENSVQLLLPAFIDSLNTPEFKARLDLFLESSLPVQIDCKCRFVESDDLVRLIPAFVKWHNLLVYRSPVHPYPKVHQHLHTHLLHLASRELAKLIIKINDRSNAGNQ